LLFTQLIQNGLTALIASSFNGHVEAVEVLVNAGAAVDMQSKVLLYLMFDQFFLFLRVVAVLPHAPSVRTHHLLVATGV